ncbi:MAG: multiheme c-type cytochrome [bacterium]
MTSAQEVNTSKEKKGDDPTTPAAVSFKYIGVHPCKGCHNRKSKGDQYKKWKQSGHAEAYRVLAGTKAKEIASKLKIGDPQQAPACLKCHTTAYGSDRLGPMFKPEDGVQCETCHGPGSRYRYSMKNRKKSLKNGLVLPKEKLCRTCHNDESPTFKGFDFQEMFTKITHNK